MSGEEREERKPVASWYIFWGSQEIVFRYATLCNFILTPLENLATTKKSHTLFMASVWLPPAGQTLVPRVYNTFTSRQKLLNDDKMKDDKGPIDT